MNEKVVMVMESECKHVPIEKAARLVQERLQSIGFNEIVIEDDDPEFKNFIATGDQIPGVEIHVGGWLCKEKQT